MSLIKADLEGIKKYSTAMNAGDMYGLFACMLTARSWKAITSGIDKQGYTQSEVDWLSVCYYLLQHKKNFLIFFWSCILK